MKFKALAVASTIAMCAGSAQSQESFEMTSAFGKNLPILGSAAVDFTVKINSISTEVEFEQFDPGELVPALEALDAVSNGSVDAAYTTAGYWQGKITAASLFAVGQLDELGGLALGFPIHRQRGSGGHRHEPDRDRGLLVVEPLLAGFGANHRGTELEPF